MDTSAVRVDLFGVECNTDVPDSDGCVWSVAEVRGWDSPGQRSSSFPLTGRHGSSGPSPLADGRVLVIPGDVVGPSRAALDAAYDRIAASMPGLLGSGDVAVHQTVPKFVTARQHFSPKIGDPIGRGFSFELEVIADYPQKRAVTPTTVTIAAGTSETFSVGGNFAAEVEVETTTAGTVSLTRSGSTLATSALPAGSVLKSIDRTIVDDAGADAYTSIVAGSVWLGLAPGSNTVANNGTAAVTLTFYDTYA